MPSSFAIERVHIFDGSQVIPQNTIVVENGRIAALGENISPPRGILIINGEGQTLLPGLIDAHTHIWSAHQLRQALLFGVTTELDMFMSVKTMHKLKKPGRRGREMADIRSAGTLATAPGGHGTEYGIRIPTLLNAAEAQDFVDERIKEGSDYIKIILDDGRAINLAQPTISKELLIALVEAAHKRDKVAIVHTISYQEAREAIEAGADGLAHLFADEMPASDFGQFIAAHHAFVIPTLTVIESICGIPSGAPLIADTRLTPYLAASTISNLQRDFPLDKESSNNFALAQKAISLLKEAQVPLLAGTDAPNPGTSHGVSMHRELELLVQAGLTPSEALASATSVPATTFGLSDRGRIAPGLRADLLLVRGDPTSDIQATRDIVGVWKNGIPAPRQAYRTALEKHMQKLHRRPEPAAAQGGLISDFENGKTTSRFGSRWRVSTDRRVRGRSKATCNVVAGGADGEAYALSITGEVSPALAFAWAGVTFFPGGRIWRTANLSSKKGISFWTRGDGQTYRVMISTGNLASIPATVSFTAGANWEKHDIPFEQLHLSEPEKSEVRYITFAAGPRPGPFAFLLDRITLFS